MPKWLSSVLGAVEIAGGAALSAFVPGVGAVIGSKLIALGIGTEISGIGQLLSKGPVKGGSTTERNPIAPREIGYGESCTGGTPLYILDFGEENSSTGINKWQDMVIDLYDCPIQGVTSILMDKSNVQFNTSQIVAGAPTSISPYINAGMSFTPAQQNDQYSNDKSVLIYNISRTGGVVTLVTEGSGESRNNHSGGDIPYLQAGVTFVVTDVPSGDGHSPGDSSMNGHFLAQSVQHFSSGGHGGGSYCIITYLCGGVDANVAVAGYCGTLWPNYGSRIWFELMKGNQLLGHTFASLTVNNGVETGTPNPSNPGGGGAITYQNQGYGLPPWSNYCSGVGCSLAFLRFNYDSTQMPFIPQISFVVQGKNNIYDPRLGPYTGTGTAALSNAGSGYAVGDVLIDPAHSAQITVTGIDGTGTGPIITWSVTAPGSGYTIGGTFSITGGTGSGAQFTVLILAGSTGTTGYTNNAALCCADFMCDQVYGYKMGYGAPNGVNIPALITAANICDQQVALAQGGFESRYTCNGKYNSNQTRGEVLTNLLSSMSGRITEQDGQYNLVAGAWLGSYGAEWVSTAAYTPGEYAVYSGVAYQAINSNTNEAPPSYPGDWLLVPTAAPPLGAMLPLEWSPAPSITGLYNAVKGTYIFPGNNWQPSDFPPFCLDSTHGYTLGVAWTSGHTFAAGDYTVYAGYGYQSLQGSNTGHTPGASGSGQYWALAYQDILVTEDGGDRRWLDVQLPFTNSAATAQRIAKIQLLIHRQLGTGVLRFNLSGYQFTALDIITLTFPPWESYGWTGKLFEILTSRFTPDPKGLSTEFAVQETDESIYDWNPATEELTPAGYVQPFIGTPANLPTGPPTNLVLESDVTTAFIDNNGIARSQILVTWTAPADGYVIGGGHIEAQFQLVSSPPSPWLSLPSLIPTVTQFYITDVTDQDQYNVQIRSVNVNGVPSVWVEAGPVTVTGSAFLALGPPADVYYSISTDGEGNITAYGISVTNGDSPPTPAMGVTAVIYDVFYADMTAQATTFINSFAFTAVATSMPYGGPLSVGYAAVGVGSPNCELIYVVGIGPPATIERGVLGSTAQDWSAVSTVITAVNSLWNLEFTVATGLNIIPGMRARNSSPYTNSFVTEYNSATGLVRLTAPLGNVPTVSSAVDFYHQITPLLSIERSIPTPSIGFFGGPNLADFNDTFPLPSSAILYTQMKAHNNYSGEDQIGGPTVGADSAWFPLLFTSSPLFTHGGTLIVMNTGNSSSIPSGDTVNIYGPCIAAETQDFGTVSASIANITGAGAPPIPAPAPVSDIRLLAQVPTGTITIGGTVDSTTVISVGVIVNTAPTPRYRHGLRVFANDWVAVNNGFEGWGPGLSYSLGESIIDPAGHIQTVTTAGISGSSAPAWNDSGGTTPDGTGALVWTDGGLEPITAVATSLCAWLNSDPVFSSYYSCTVTGAVISITDETNSGGVLQTTATGSTTATPTGLTSALGILVGAFYAIAYADTTDGYLGLTSAFVASSSTGPTGSYSELYLGNIPTTTDTRVNQINIYRGADGTPFGLNTPLYLAGTTTNTSSGDSDGTGFTTFTDNMTEATLLTQTIYPGQTQPTQPDDLVLKVSKNGNPWFQLHVPPGSFSSNVVPGIAIRGLAQGTSQTVEVVNNIGALDITVTEN